MLGYLISPVLQVENTDGKPLVGGRIVVYRHGTTEPYITYKDFEGTHNPAEVILDSKGMCILIAEEGYSYDVYCRDRNYVEQWSRIGISIGLGGTSIISRDGTITVKSAGGVVDLGISDNDVTVLTGTGAERGTDGNFAISKTASSREGLEVTGNRIKVKKAGWFHIEATWYAQSNTTANGYRTVELATRDSRTKLTLDLTVSSEQWRIIANDFYLHADEYIDFTLSGMGSDSAVRSWLQNVSIHRLTNIVGNPPDRVRPDWAEQDPDSPAYIFNKPNLATVATTGSYNDLTDKPNLDVYATKVENATEGNLAALDAEGNLVDSGEASENLVHDANYVHTDNNYTTADKDKLAGIEDGAEVNVQADWTEDDSSEDSYIQNKPHVPTVSGDGNSISSIDGLPIYAASATRTTQDGAGNNIVDTYAKESAMSGKQDKLTTRVNISIVNGVIDLHNNECSATPNSVAIGDRSKSVNNYGFVHGRYATNAGQFNAMIAAFNESASGTYNIVGGSQNVVAGNWNTVVGSGNTVSANNFHVIHGIGNEINAFQCAHAEGSGTKANNSYAHTEGVGTVATGTGAHSEGSGTSATGIVSHSEGRYSIAAGNYAHADGDRSSAFGVYSQALGKETYAGGQYSFAIGNYAMASGDESFAMGTLTRAVDADTHAEGVSTSAFGRGAHSEGHSTIASATYAHAEGESTNALNIGAHSEGSGTSAVGVYSHAEGEGTRASRLSHAEGRMTSASNDYAHTEGNQTFANGVYSHAEGYASSAISNRSHTEGEETITSGQGSHAEGYQSVAVGVRSHAEGANTIAVAAASHSEGYKTVSNGQYSHAEGANTSAINNFSHAEGRYTITDTVAQHAEGQYNAPAVGALHVIGNGTGADNRSNIVETYTSGVNVNGSFIASGVNIIEQIKNIGDVVIKYAYDAATNAIIVSGPCTVNTAMAISATRMGDNTLINGRAYDGTNYYRLNQYSTPVEILAWKGDQQRPLYHSLTVVNNVSAWPSTLPIGTVNLVRFAEGNPYVTNLETQFTDLSGRLGTAYAVYMFQNCTNLTGNIVPYMDAARVQPSTRYSAMFRGCSGVDDYETLRTSETYSAFF